MSKAGSQHLIAQGGTLAKCPSVTYKPVLSHPSAALPPGPLPTNLETLTTPFGQHPRSESTLVGCTRRLDNILPGNSREGDGGGRVNDGKKTQPSHLDSPSSRGWDPENENGLFAWTQDICHGKAAVTAPSSAPVSRSPGVVSSLSSVISTYCSCCILWSRDSLTGIGIKRYLIYIITQKICHKESRVSEGI